MPITRVCNGDSTQPNAFQSLALTDMPGGVATRCAGVSLTVQSANIGSTPLYAVSSTGFYRICISIKRTQIATTSSTLPSVTIGWTDGDNSAAGSNTPIATNTTNTLVAALSSEIVVYAKAATNITYSTTGYVSTGASVLQYALKINCEAI